MKIIELIKIKKARKSQDAVADEKPSKIKISKTPNGTRPDDSYISGGDVPKGKNDGNTDQV